jgi:hypothetical protein
MKGSMDFGHVYKDAETEINSNHWLLAFYLSGGVVFCELVLDFRRSKVEGEGRAITWEADGNLLIRFGGSESTFQCPHHSISTTRQNFQCQSIIYQSGNVTRYTNLNEFVVAVDSP